ncbi:phage antirepressor KilAC domain-containing protein [Corynebacterium sp. 13CS0277]|uniref:phage antirepressor KilAC domain-containing protein n=1 Tax=Corynebacterium sp. 13CS0277 TaxID=2071994 RepID=UPI001E2CA47A|nr:phage antirepressor KilAC domain-containing protein [Corynebacterium sp. 13CS0277]
MKAIAVWQDGNVTYRRLEDHEDIVVTPAASPEPPPQVFTFDGHPVRTFVDETGEWFCAKDVAEALGYKRARDAVQRHCKGMAKGAVKHGPLETPGGTQNMAFIAEPDVMRLIVASKLPSAQRFERWVFEEVLPAIRKHGAYATPATVEAMLADPATMIRTLQALQEEQRARREVEQQNAEMLPKAEYFDTAVADEDLIQFRTVANHLGIREKVLRETLEAKRWIYNRPTTRWSNTKRQVVNVNRWRAYADKREYFRLVARHDAPRIAGEVQQTLKFTPRGEAAVARMMRQWGVVGDEPLWT